MKRSNDDLDYIPVLYGSPEGLKRFNKSYSTEKNYYSYELLSELEVLCLSTRQELGWWVHFERQDKKTGKVLTSEEF